MTTTAATPPAITPLTGDVHTTTWAGHATALTSISHGGQTHGTITLLRREIFVQPDGTRTHVPVISGNALRGRLRRVGEELLRDVLDYAGDIDLAAAHALHSGGALAKTDKEPLTGSRLQQVRTLVPQVAVFGCAAGGRILDGALRVSKLLPRVTEVAHLYDEDWTTSAFSATQLENYAHQDVANERSFNEIVTALPLNDDGEPDIEALPDSLMYRIETFPAGTTFDLMIELHRADALTRSFFVSVLDEFNRRGRIGARGAVGMGRLKLHLTPTPDPALVDWRSILTDHRDEALDAIRLLS